MEISRKEFDKLKAEAQAYREGKPHVQQEGSSSSSEEEEVLEEFFPAEGESKDETLTESRADSSLSKLSARGKKKTWSVRMIELINPGSTVLGSTGKPLTPVIKRIRSMPEFAKEGIL